MTLSVTIRETTSEDSLVLADLLTQLGYPTPSEDLPRRIARMHAKGGVALVATIDGTVVGLATMHVHSGLNRANDVANLSLLVVDEHYRGKGIGRALVNAVEKLAVSKGCERITVTTAEDRDGAQAFYPSVGLPLTGRRYGKMLK